jgi:hypothetical protein
MMAKYYMAKYLFLLQLLFCFVSKSTLAQTYTTESKSCGACNMPVSVHSQVGMTCPHCGVRWGSENERRRTSFSYDENKPLHNDYNFDNITGFVNSNANLRSGPSKGSYILTVIPAYNYVEVIRRVGNWYYIEYSYYDYNLGTTKLNGYVHSSLIY